MAEEIKPLNKELIYQANSNSLNGKRGDLSEQDYINYAEKILSWKISDTKKRKLLNKLYEKWSEILQHEARHVSVVVAGPANYNSKKLDHSDKILSLTSDFCEWFKDLEEQIEDGHKQDDKAQRLIEMVEFAKQPNNPCDPTSHLSQLALYDPEVFKKYYEELYPTYKWRKNSNIAKLYAEIEAGTLKVIKKEVFFEDVNFTAYTEGDRVYIKFVMRPKRQLIVALKSRGYWWNSRKSAWSTYPNKLDKEWVENISERYADYI